VSVYVKQVVKDTLHVEFFSTSLELTFQTRFFFHQFSKYDLSWSWLDFFLEETCCVGVGIRARAAFGIRVNAESDSTTVTESLKCTASDIV